MIRFWAVIFISIYLSTLLHVAMSTDKVKRPRAEITHSELASQLGEFAHRKGKSFIRFDDAATVEESKNDAALLAKHKDIIDACGGQPITRKTVKRAMEAVLEDKKGKWKVEKEDEQNWVETMTRRFLNMMYHENKSSSSKKVAGSGTKAAAAAASEGGDGSSSSSKAVASAAASAPTEARGVATEDPRKKEISKKAYSFGWNAELGLAWRKPVDAQDKHKEISLAPEIVPDQPDGGTKLLVTFVDGMQKHVSLSKPEFEVFLQRSSTSASGCKPLLEAEHKKTHNKITVRQRPNRGLLVSMYDQAKQILQVRADRFGHIPDEECAKPLPHESEIIKKAVDFYRPILSKYINNEIVDKKELYEARDERFRELGMPVAHKRKQHDKEKNKDNVNNKKKQTKEKTKDKVEKERKQTKENKKDTVDMDVDDVETDESSEEHVDFSKDNVFLDGRFEGVPCTSETAASAKAEPAKSPMKKPAAAKAAVAKAKPPIPPMKKPAAAKAAVAKAKPSGIANDTETPPNVSQADAILELCRARSSKALCFDSSSDEATSNTSEFSTFDAEREPKLNELDFEFCVRLP